MPHGPALHPLLSSRPDIRTLVDILTSIREAGLVNDQRRPAEALAVPKRQGTLDALETGMCRNAHWLRLTAEERTALVRPGFLEGWLNTRKQWVQEYRLTFSIDNLWALLPDAQGHHNEHELLHVVKILEHVQNGSLPPHRPVDILRLAIRPDFDADLAALLTSRARVSPPPAPAPPRPRSPPRVLEPPADPHCPSSSQGHPGPRADFFRSLGQLSHGQAEYYRKRNAFD
ncbi:hypothetical protein JCM10207_008765 [Rhodosporidiobolus poonsookiae]